MTRSGHRGVACSTDDTAELLEDLQFTFGTGPGPTAFDSGIACLVPDLGSPGGSAGDWHAFRGAALDLGVRAMFAFPLHLGPVSLGVLTLYGTEAAGLHGSHLAGAVRLSSAAAVALHDLIVGIAGDTDAPLDRSDDGALPDFYRAETYHAAGMLTVQLGVTIEVAMVRLRSHAYATGRSTSDVARDVVARKLHFEADTRPT